MQLKLEQLDIEEAISDYLIKMGITRQVSEIDFTQGRGSDAQLTADIVLRRTDGSKVSAAPVVTDEPRTTVDQIVKEVDGNSDTSLFQSDTFETRDSAAPTEKLFG
jgi:hypothetical protein|tara:strand:+ start:5039 stop:5356 length:318 start_codon:yes stop_codon:yes gene_type:complete